jgi:hypothetical protein
MEGSGNGAFFVVLRKEDLRHLAREGSANMLIEPETALHVFFCHV